MQNPFIKPRPNPKRDTPRRVGSDRVRLHGEAKTARRQEIFKRSGGRCEVVWDGERCTNEITWNTMHWSHNRHAANKSDDLKDGLAACSSCHQRQHNAGGKPVRKKPGRVMKLAEAMRYWRGKTCFCDGEKPAEDSFCGACKAKLSPQLRLDLEELKNDQWLQAVALSEMEILQAGHSL